MLTGKQAGYFGWIPLEGSEFYPDNLSFHIMVNPSNSHGMVFLLFGEQDESNFYALKVDWSEGPSAAVRMLQITAEHGWEAASETQNLPLPIKKWCSIELRITGKNIQVFINHAMTMQETVNDYQPGEIAYGVGLAEQNKGMTFPVAFDNITIYSMK